MIERLKKFVQENWTHLELPGSCPGETLVMLISGSVGVQGKVVLLFFAKGERDPFLVAKVARDQRYAQYLNNEYRNLKALREIAAVGSPAPLYLGSFGTNTVLLESPVLGERVERLMGKGKSLSASSEYLDLLMNWIEQFGVLTRRDVCASGDEARKLLRGPIEEFMGNFTLNEAEREVIDKTMDKLEGLGDRTIPLVFVHGDMWPGNAFLKDNKFGFIDWECSSIRGLPYFDLFTFFVSYCRIFFNNSHSIPARKIFLNGASSFLLLKEYMHSYSDALGIDRELCGVFFALYLIIFSNREYAFRLADAEKGYLRESYIADKDVSISEAIKQNLRYFNFFKTVAEEKILERF